MTDDEGGTGVEPGITGGVMEGGNGGAIPRRREWRNHTRRRWERRHHTWRKGETWTPKPGGGGLRAGRGVTPGKAPGGGGVPGKAGGALEEPRAQEELELEKVQGGATYVCGAAADTALWLVSEGAGGGVLRFHGHP